MAPSEPISRDFADVSVNGALAARPDREPDYKRENEALNALALEFARPLSDVLQLLCDTALELCRAHSAGVSLLETENGEPIFRWLAISGQWARFKGGFLPRDQSPCGIVVRENAFQLMEHPGRYFAPVAQVEPAIVEALLLPFHVLGEPVGTVWILSHDKSLRFQQEDRRIMQSLAAFAGAAYLMRSTLARALETSDELGRTNDRLLRANQRMFTRLEESSRL